MLSDSFHRKINYVRLSVTDRCNLRCVYCLPRSFDLFSPTEEMLTDEEILFLISCFAELGIAKIRITGGEPLVRQGLPKLIRRMSQIKGISDLSLSTNGMLLSQQAQELSQAGLKRVNVSLDSLKPDTFQQMTRFGRLNRVLEGIDSAEKAGLSPVKINVVVARGINDVEINDFVTLTEKRSLHVRFIELMPMGETGFFSSDKLVPLNEMMERAQPLIPLVPDDWPVGYGPARYYKRPGAKGTVGFISALSCGFCSSCNRLRLSAKGTLVPCLDASDGTDLKTPLRQNASRDEIKQLIQETVMRKPESHHMREKVNTSSANPRLMCQIGG